jgi:glutamine synthetase
VLLDNTDRNRTSPFAFTGNKFEFRAVGSAANCANSMVVLNTIVADQLNSFKTAVDKRIKSGVKKDEAILKELQKLIKESKAIIFEGDGYSDDWVKEAKKRGLSNFRNTPEALAVWKKKEVHELFESLNVLSAPEIESRLEVALEDYVLKRQIEARVCGDIAQNHIIPTAITYQNRIIENVKGMKEIFSAGELKKATTMQTSLILSISSHMNGIKANVDELLEQRRKVDSLDSLEKKAKMYAEVIKPLTDEIREHSDQLEMMVDDELWPMPKLRELLFAR